MVSESKSQPESESESEQSRSECHCQQLQSPGQRGSQWLDDLVQGFIVSNAAQSNDQTHHDALLVLQDVRVLGAGVRYRSDNPSTLLDNPFLRLST